MHLTDGETGAWQCCIAQCFCDKGKISSGGVEGGAGLAMGSLEVLPEEQRTQAVPPALVPVLQGAAMSQRNSQQQKHISLALLFSFLVAPWGRVRTLFPPRTTPIPGAQGSLGLCVGDSVRSRFFPMFSFGAEIRGVL